MKALLTVYTREGCHLCDAFLDEFLPLAQHFQLDYAIRDVDETPQLRDCYGHRVPLLMANDRVICEYFLDPAKLDEYVQELKVG